MKPLLISVVIVIFVLLLSVYILHPQMKKTESFVDSGDIYSLQTGQNQFETLTKLESDVNNIIVKEEQLSTDFSSWRADSGQQLKDLTTRTTQYQTDTSGKFTSLTDLQKKDANDIGALNKSVGDFSAQMKSANDKLVVIDGRLVAINDAHTQQITGLRTDVNKLNEFQTGISDRITANNNDVMNKVNTGLNNLTTSMNTNLATQGNSIKNLEGSYNTVNNAFNTFKTSQTQLNDKQTSSYNEIGQKTVALNDAISVAQNRISDVAKLFNDYMKKADMTNYAQKTDLNAYATQNQMANYATKLDIANTISRSELSTYVPRREVQTVIDAVTNANGALKDLATTVKTIASSYVNQSDFASKAIAATGSTDLRIGLQATQNSVASLGTTVSTIANNYVTKTDLPKLALDASGSAMLKQSIDGTNASLANLSNQVAAMQAQGFVTKTALPQLAIDATGSASLKTALDNNIKTVTGLSDTLGTIQKALPNYVARTEMNDTLSGYFKKTDVSSLASKTDLTTYALKADLDKAVTNLTALVSGLKAGTASIMDNLQINQTLKVNQIKASPNTWDKQLPSGWGGGVHSFDVYANATIAAGVDGGVASYMNSSGQVVGKYHRSTGNDDGWNWMHVYRNEGDQLLFGGDNTNRGIWSSGVRPFTVYTNDKPSLSVDKDGNTSTKGNIIVGGKLIAQNNPINLREATDPNHGIQYSAAVDGPNVYGWSGGSLGVTNQPKTALQWNQVGDVTLPTAGLKFSRNWTASTEGNGNQNNAEISNDVSGAKTLMIVGNRSAGAERRVDVWDKLQVNGSLNTNGNINATGTLSANGAAYVNSTGQVVGKYHKSTGNDDGWNWMHVARNDGDLLFGGDNGNRGIWSAGDRPFTVYTSGQPRLSVDKDGNTDVRNNFSAAGMKVTRNWTGAPDADKNNAEISNDNKDYKTLMIVGNKSAGAERRVDVWDRLQVNGSLNAGNISGGNINANGNITFGGYINAQDKPIFLRDGNHGLQWNAQGDGPRLWGNQGGTLGTVNGKTAAQWNQYGDLSIGSVLYTNRICSTDGKKCIDLSSDGIALNNPRGDVAKLQGDGNFAVYNRGSAKWATNTYY